MRLQWVDGATIYTSEDNSARTATFVGNAQLDTARKKFGSAALLTDGVGDSVTFANHATFAFGTGDFTIEFWCFAGSFPNAYSAAIGKWNAGGNQRGWDMEYRAANSRWEFFYSTNGAASVQSNGTTAMASGG